MSHPTRVNASLTEARAASSVSSPLIGSERESGYTSSTSRVEAPSSSPILQGKYPAERPSPNVFWRVVRFILRNSRPQRQQQGARGRRRSSSSSIDNRKEISLRAISHRSAHVRLFRLLWCLMLLLGEHGSFWWMVHRCQWPENSSWDKSDDAMKDRYRVAIIADPQLTDLKSYNQSGLLLALVEAYTDIFMRRSFRRLHSSLRPDAVLFLGDLNDGGRQTEGETFEKNRRRFFEHVFQTKSTAWNQEPVIMDLPDGNNTDKEIDSKKDDIKIAGHYHLTRPVPAEAKEREHVRNAGKSLRLYVAGNHDVGFGDTLVRWTMLRHKKVFGSVNYEVDVGNHTFVILDTLAFSSSVADIREESQQFINGIKEETPTFPRILFTHVPLFRLDTTYCGDERETKQLIINRGGDQYQNMVNAPLSKEILEAIQPDMVFSGDDHDWCEIAHSYQDNSNRGPSTETAAEVTLPTFSFAQGIQQPGFVMLSLYNPRHESKNAYPFVPSTSGLPTALNQSLLESSSGSQSIARPSGDSTLAYQECLLPRQLLIYIVYGGFFALTLGVLLVKRYQWMLQSRQLLANHSLLLRWSRASPETDVDPEGLTTAASMSPNAPSTDATTVNVDDSTQGEQGDEEWLDTQEVDLRRREEAMVLESIFATSSTKQQHVWPLRMRLYWAMIGWDILNVAMYAIPFYVLLFIISLL